MSARCAAIIVAGGSGKRFGRTGGKQLAAVHGRPVFVWATQALAAVRSIDLLVVVCPAERLEEHRLAVESVSDVLSVLFASSGVTRQASVAAGLAMLPDSVETVAVHDGARPLVRTESVTRALDLLARTPEADGVVLGHPSVDTLKRVVDGRIIETPDRNEYWSVQTPQVFRTSALRRAHEAADRDGFTASDDAGLVERLGGIVLVIQAERDNIKVTLPEDAAVAAALLSLREKESR